LEAEDSSAGIILKDECQRAIKKNGEEAYSKEGTYRGVDFQSFPVRIPVGGDRSLSRLDPKRGQKDTTHKEEKKIEV